MIGTVQRSCSDADAAALYDVLNPWGADSAFYLPLVLQARAALDIGCGTGQLLHRARDAGHPGRLCGVDPDPAMLARAKRRRYGGWGKEALSDVSAEIITIARRSWGDAEGDGYGPA